MSLFNSANEFIENLELLLFNFTNLSGDRRTEFWKHTISEARKIGSESELMDKLDELCQDTNVAIRTSGAE